MKALYLREGVGKRRSQAIPEALVRIWWQSLSVLCQLLGKFLYFVLIWQW